MSGVQCGIRGHGPSRRTIRALDVLLSVLSAVNQTTIVRCSVFAYNPPMSSPSPRLAAGLFAVLGAVLGVAMCLAVLSSVFMAPKAVAGQAYLSVSDDIPLMPTLTEDPDAALVFDSPDGRIVEAAAAGAADITDIRTYYSTVLPQLGWTDHDNGRFIRSGEQLMLEIAEREGLRVVRFRFSPVTP